jgi:hypothetical protein
MERFYLLASAVSQHQTHYNGRGPRHTLQARPVGSVHRGSLSPSAQDTASVAVNAYLAVAETARRHDGSAFRWLPHLVGWDYTKKDASFMAVAIT